MHRACSVHAVHMRYTRSAHAVHMQCTCGAHAYMHACTHMHACTSTRSMLLRLRSRRCSPRSAPAPREERSSPQVHESERSCSAPRRNEPRSTAPTVPALPEAPLWRVAARWRRLLGSAIRRETPQSSSSSTSRSGNRTSETSAPTPALASAPVCHSAGGPRRCSALALAKVLSIPRTSM